MLHRRDPLPLLLPVARFPKLVWRVVRLLRHIKMAHAMPSWFGFLVLEAHLAMTFIDCQDFTLIPENPPTLSKMRARPLRKYSAAW